MTVTTLLALKTLIVMLFTGTPVPVLVLISFFQLWCINIMWWRHFKILWMLKLLTLQWSILVWFGTIWIQPLPNMLDGASHLLCHIFKLCLAHVISPPKAHNLVNVLYCDTYCTAKPEVQQDLILLRLTHLSSCRTTVQEAYCSATPDPVLFPSSWGQLSD